MDIPPIAIVSLIVAGVIFIVGVAVAEMQGGDDDDDHFAW